MENKFEVEFLPEAVSFMNSLDKKSQEKIYYNIRPMDWLKRQEKHPKADLEKAERIRKHYFEQK